MSTAQKSLINEVMKLVQLILVFPATNAVSERSFSALRRLKNYLRNSMSQQRLNHVALLNIRKSFTDKLDLKAIGNEFISACTSCENVFGKST